MSNTVANLLFPISKEDFTTNIGETRWHHFKQTSVESHNEEFLNDLNQFLGRNDICYPAVRLVRDGYPIPTDQYYRANLNGEPGGRFFQIDRAFEMLNEGSTLIIQTAYSNMSSFERYSQELADGFGCQVDLSVFITPKHSVGLRAHYDTSSSFIIQLFGAKRWRVYEPYRTFPLRNNTFSFAEFQKTALVADVILRKEERLYIPRGWIHEPSTQEGLSIRLTISLELESFIETMRQGRLNNTRFAEIASKEKLREIMSLLR